MGFCRRCIAISAIVAAFWGGQTLAQDLDIAVPYTAGSGSDIVARLIAEELAPRLDQSVIILNQPGASGLVAAQAVKNAEADGNTILFTTTNHALLPATRLNLGLDVVEDFEPVLRVSAGPLILVVNADLGVASVAELVALAKSENEKGGALRYATPGIGTAPHLAVEQLSAITGIEMVAVPYPGGPQAMTDVLAGEVSFYMGTLGGILPFIEGGAIPLGVAAQERLGLAGDIPTFAEEGIEGFTVEYWNCFLAPAGTPPERVAELQAAIAEVVMLPAVKEALAREGLEVDPSTSEEFGEYLRAEVDRWTELAEAAGVEPQ